METNATLRYEALILAVPEITVDESSALEAQLQDVISKNKSEVLSFDRWGKYRLAYEVRKNEYGVYYLVRFEIPTTEKPKDLLEKLRLLFAVKYNELVMRHVFARLDSSASLEYKRPESLEETPRRDFGSYSRENRSSGFSRDDRRPDFKSEAKPETAKPATESVVVEEKTDAAPQETPVEQASTEDAS